MQNKISSLKALIIYILGNSLVIFSRPIQAQIIPDSTLNSESTQVRPVSPQEQIIEGGAIRGENLFQSFEQFNVGQNQTVNFANPENISNIFSRVTGSEISQILGNLGVLGEANLWLLNPNGFIFGKNASLNLNGSFITTTAESINFSNGTRFAANAVGEPLLTISQPTALEFGTQPGTIVNRAQSPRLAQTNFQFNTLRSPAGLLVQPQQTLALIGGDIVSEGGNLTALGGNIEVGAVGANSLVGLDFSESGLTFNYQAVTNFADIRFSDRDGEITLFVVEDGQVIVDENGQPQTNIVPSRVSSFTDASSTFSAVDFTPIASGSINFVGGNIEFLNGSEILVLNFTELPGGNISIQASGQLTFAGENLSILRPITNFLATNTFGDGNAGNITIRVNSLILSDQATISSATTGISNPFTGDVALTQGAGGAISVEVTDSILLDSEASIFTNTTGDGNAGSITIDTRGLTISNQATINSSASSVINPLTG